MANLKLIFPSDDMDQVTYICPKNFDYGDKPGSRENLNDDNRTFDGTLLRYAGPIKKRFEMTFSYVSKAQKDYFLMLWDFQCPIDLYRDGINLDGSFLMEDCPVPSSQAAFDDSGNYTYSFDVVWKEV